jgi:Holliday junction resolvasome RuvABC ATP-dependent DNA helicase subunit
MGKSVKVEGQLAVKDGASIGLEFYEAEFLLDDAVKTEADARSLIQGGLISTHLKKTVPNFKRWRTCEVVSFESTSDKAANSELDALMLDAIKKDCLPENIDAYNGEENKVKALKKALESEKKRKAKVKKEEVIDEGYID